MEFIRFLKYETEEKIAEKLKQYKFKLIENINGYKTFIAHDEYKTFTLMEFPGSNEYSFCYNNLIYRSMKKELFKEIIER